jgi:hypothetical protein
VSFSPITNMTGTGREGLQSVSRSTNAPAQAGATAAKMSASRQASRNASAPPFEQPVA